MVKCTQPLPPQLANTRHLNHQYSHILLTRFFLIICCKQNEFVAKVLYVKYAENNGLCNFEVLSKIGIAVQCKYGVFRHVENPCIIKYVE